ncbi:MAG TPA: D-aminoacyl-tRNA deacylase [Chitinophagales bacterium]|nr:D-aminoacyl-tRNA deacylase [Chitinophagales bacterium]HMW11734.1 D-aminoacyl-tRNA deacylase [Chitinophagales bacterium]HMX60552.1 D-aminoacyl-tRNA deacylase [Chitinophagales bacterium]HMY23474.1 D-aminoacyl-tRNA deacylase [Chitinophagales bacterium]HMZ32750.1 D-aminoacyl-tRNA deacylase [Chitinophagales bacterium]
MRVVIQRVANASVSIEGIEKGKINTGLLIFLGIEEQDDAADIAYLVKKIIPLRIFSDEAEKMNLSIQDIHGDILLISQFTLHASTKKGNRPSFIRAAKPASAIPLYEQFIKEMELQLGKKICTGIFGADMKITLLNDGPVTIIIDSKNPE